MANNVDPVEMAYYVPSHLDLQCLDRCLFWSAGLTGLTLYVYRDWSGEPNNATADTDCVNINYGGYYEVKKCSDKQSFICQKAAILPPRNSTNAPTRGYPNRTPARQTGNVLLSCGLFLSSNK